MKILWNDGEIPISGTAPSWPPWRSPALVELLLGHRCWHEPWGNVGEMDWKTPFEICCGKWIETIWNLKMWKQSYLSRIFQESQVNFVNFRQISSFWHTTGLLLLTSCAVLLPGCDGDGFAVLLLRAGAVLMGKSYGMMAIIAIHYKIMIHMVEKSMKIHYKMIIDDFFVIFSSFWHGHWPFVPSLTSWLKRSQVPSHRLLGGQIAGFRRRNMPKSFAPGLWRDSGERLWDSPWKMVV